MIDSSIWRKGWALLDADERRNAWITLFIVILCALTSALMVGSVLPFLSVLSDPSKITTVHALAWAYDKFYFSSTYGFLIGLGFASLGAITLASLMQIVKTWAVARFAMMRMHSISHRLMAAYLRQPYEFFLNRHSGEMGTRVLAETVQVVNQFLRPAADLVAAALATIAIVGLLIWINPQVALVAVGALGGIYGAVYALSRRTLNRLGRERVAANNARFRVANEALSGIKDIKLLGRELSYIARYAALSRRMARTQVRVQIISQVPQFVLQAIALGGIILLSLLLMDAGRFSSGKALGDILPTLGLFAFAGQRLMPELSKIYQSLAQIQAAAGAVDIIYEDLISCSSGTELPRSIPAGLGLRDRLVLEAVSYHYPNSAQTGIRDVALEIRAGEKIGIVGETGAGKTTLADLILGLLAPSKGQLVVDGQTVSSSNLRSWQQSVGYVPQDIFLTDASVVENIALGVPPDQIDHNRAREAARIAQLDKFIRNDLPNGYATTIGERGVRLSGGQRQRIGIARALYHDADLLVLDEATSALDNLTEQDVMGAIDALPREKTVILIAHRLSTVQRCDRIVVMEKGSVVGCNSWTELMAHNRAFQRIGQTRARAELRPDLSTTQHI